MSEKAAEAATHLRRRFIGPMSHQEVEFLQDMQAAIEYALHNGLSFPMIASTLCHDLTGLAQTSFDLDATRARGIELKVSTLGKLRPEDFGDSAEP